MIARRKSRLVPLFLAGVITRLCLKVLQTQGAPLILKLKANANAHLKSNARQLLDTVNVTSREERTLETLLISESGNEQEEKVAEEKSSSQNQEKDPRDGGNRNNERNGHTVAAQDEEKHIAHASQPKYRSDNPLRSLDNSDVPNTDVESSIVKNGDRGKCPSKNFCLLRILHDVQAFKIDRYQHSLQRLPSAWIAVALTAILKTYTSEPARRAVYFWRHAGPIVGHYIWTQRILKKEKGDKETIEDEKEKERRHAIYNGLHDRYSGPIMDLILHLRGLYVKIGQVLSTRPDMIPHQYIELFETLQDSIPQWPIQDIHEIVSTTFRKEFGLNLEDVFESMDFKALGSASIGQVHRAVLTESFAETLRKDHNYTGSRVVAVKVMHPGVEERFHHDFQVFRWLCRLAAPDWHGILEELRRRLMTEFDYRREAESLAEVRTNLIHSPYADRVCVPEPVQSLCCKEILVMEMLNGTKLISAIEEDLVVAFGDAEKAAEFLAQKKQELIKGTGHSQEILDSLGFSAKFRLLSLVRKCRRYIKLLVDVHGKQIFVDGFFNGDPHFGNVLRLDDGRLGLIDYGQTRRLTNEERLGIAKVVAALGQDSDEASIAHAMRKLGFTLKRNDDDVMMVKYAKIFFDSDQEGTDLGFPTIQHYFEFLMAENPLVNIPESAVFVARVSFLFRGMGSAIGGKQIRSSTRWWRHAHQVLEQESSEVI